MQEKPIFYWRNFRETDYYVPQEWHGNKPSTDRTSDEEFDELVDEYLMNPNQGFGRWITNLFIGEFKERRKAQPNFTNMKEEIKKREDAKREAEAKKREAEAKKREAKKKEDVKRKAEAKNRRKERKLTEKDLKGEYPKFDYYELLLVPNYANTREINTAFKQLMKIYHPDKNPKGKKLAEKIAKKLNEAHDVLKNQNSRIKYDEEHRFT